MDGAKAAGGARLDPLGGTGGNAVLGSGDGPTPLEKKFREKLDRYLGYEKSVAELMARYQELRHEIRDRARNVGELSRAVAGLQRDLKALLGRRRSEEERAREIQALAEWLAAEARRRKRMESSSSSVGGQRGGDLDWGSGKGGEDEEGSVPTLGMDTNKAVWRSSYVDEDRGGPEGNTYQIPSFETRQCGGNMFLPESPQIAKQKRKQGVDLVSGCGKKKKRGKIDVPRTVLDAVAEGDVAAGVVLTASESDWDLSDGGEIARAEQEERGRINREREKRRKEQEWEMYGKTRARGKEKSSKKKKAREKGSADVDAPIVDAKEAASKVSNALIVDAKGVIHRQDSFSPALDVVRHPTDDALDVVVRHPTDEEVGIFTKLFGSGDPSAVVQQYVEELGEDTLQLPDIVRNYVEHLVCGVLTHSRSKAPGSRDEDEIPTENVLKMQRQPGVPKYADRTLTEQARRHLVTSTSGTSGDETGARGREAKPFAASSPSRHGTREHQRGLPQSTTASPPKSPMAGRRHFYPDESDVIVEEDPSTRGHQHSSPTREQKHAKSKRREETSEGNTEKSEKKRKKHSKKDKKRARRERRASDDDRLRASDNDAFDFLSFDPPLSSRISPRVQTAAKTRQILRQRKIILYQYDNNGDPIDFNALKQMNCPTQIAKHYVRALSLEIVSKLMVEQILLEEKQRYLFEQTLLHHTTPYLLELYEALCARVTAQRNLKKCYYVGIARFVAIRTDMDAAFFIGTGTGGRFVYIRAPSKF